jgi:predicted NACHT family NTPase
VATRVPTSIPERQYNWKRFWCPREGNIALTDAGYLEDPDTPWGHIQNPDVRSFGSISDSPCLVLLGEPGMGKTYAMKTEARVQQDGARVLLLDLGGFSSEERLVRRLFQNETFKAWTRGEHHLHLFLDSLDEGLLGINTLSDLLSDELAEYPIDRLYLRLACRTAAWPNTLERALQSMWDNDKVGIYELAPLRLTDVAQAATATGVAAEQFLDEVSRMEAAPLAGKPVTLGFLLKTFARNRALPSRRSDLYEQGCELLCEETNESRRERGYKSGYSATQRMAVAARIAAVTVYGNRYAVWRGTNSADAPEEDVWLSHLCGGHESCDGQPFEVNEDAVNEALDTGLFSSRGPRRMGWAHQTYAEYLAAWYSVHNEMALTQVMSLVVHPSDPDGKLVPQLHETAGWLAGMRADVFNEVLTRDPEVLLRSDVATAEEAGRANLVDALLEGYDEDRLLPPDLIGYRTYGRLAHSGLARQLLPYIADSTKGALVRRVAIEIARACQLRSAQEEVADIALDASEPVSLRQRAAAAVRDMADDQTKLRLKPLATAQIPEDQDDELKGLALSTVWPEHLTADELFAALTPPKNEGLLGMYHRFLSYDLAWHLEGDQLATALEWVERQTIRSKLPYAFGAAMDAIMMCGCQHLDEPDVVPAYARAALSRLRQHDEIVGGISASRFSELVAQVPEKRRLLVSAIVPLMSDPSRDAFWLTYPGNQLVGKDDLLWLIDLLKATDSDKGQRILAEIIRMCFDIGDPVHQRAIYTESQESAALADAFAWLLKPVELNSPEAARLMEWHKARERLEQRAVEPEDLDASARRERVEDLLRECEAGDSSAWWRLNWAMMLGPGSLIYPGELESDLTQLPGWTEADDQTRGRIVKAAGRYVAEQAPNTADGVHRWVGQQVVHPPTFAGYRALLLMMHIVPEFVDALPQSVWEIWAPIIVAYPIPMGTPDDEPHIRLTQAAYCHTPHKVIDTLLLMIDKENDEGEHIFVTRKLEGSWDGRLGTALLTKAKDARLKPGCMGSLLHDLLLHRVDGATAFAQSLVPLRTNPEKRSRAVVAARELLCHGEHGGWSVVWPAIVQDPDLGREVIQGIAHTLDFPAATIAERLSEEQLADLYIWLVDQYPYDDGPAHSGVGFVTPWQSTAEFRDSILTQLKQRGTPEACDAIRQIIAEFPRLHWVKWVLMEAQGLARRRTWSPPQPSEILQMASDRNARLVQSGTQLLGAVIESIGRLETTLQEGEPPAAIDLWNEIKRGGVVKFTPKDEGRLSDYVKRHLEADLGQRGIIANREVQIMRGDKTDIHVAAVVQRPDGNTYDSIRAIIEVKGCWHAELDTAMKTQLVGQYLEDSGCPNGLYMVGWFNCGSWDEDTPRRRAAARAGIDIEDLRGKLDAQASALSKQGLTVRALVLNAALC